jgi:hypothetical protein
MALNGYVQVPPDSTGKKVAHVILVELAYQNGVTPFIVGESVTGVTSGANGLIIKITGNTAAGDLYLVLNYESPTAFISGENLQVDAITKAVANGVGDSVHQPTVSIVDHENPFQGTNVTAQGELIVSPAESPFSFDSFGSLRAKGENAIGIYQFRYGVDSLKMQSITASVGGTITSSSYYDGAILSNPITSGSKSKISSHLYHPYIPNTGQSIIASITCGDTGKAGLIRRWGYFDDRDGLFFELSASIMNVVTRNSGTGTVVETKVPQTEWNIDRVDGQDGEYNISLANLDPSKGNVYYIDFQWLGVGRIRFGILHEGRRVIVHSEYHSQTLSFPYMSTPSLPATAEQINYGTAGSTSEMGIGSMVVAQGTNHQFPYIDRSLGTVNELTKTIDWTGSFRPIFSNKSVKTYLGKENRSITIPRKLSMYSSHAPVLFQIHQWATLTGATWTVPPQQYSLNVADATATTASNGVVVMSSIVPAQTLFEHIFPLDRWEDAFKIMRKGDIDDEDCGYTVVAKLLNNSIAPSSSLTVMLDSNIIL